jgi:hypothetical protein
MSRQRKRNAVARTRPAVNQRTARRLASLPALGAAALTMGAGSAHATIVWSGHITSGNKVGFGPGAATSATVLPGGLGSTSLRFHLFRSGKTTGKTTSRFVQIEGKYKAGHTFALGGTTAGKFLLGVKGGTTRRGRGVFNTAVKVASQTKRVVITHTTTPSHMQVTHTKTVTKTVDPFKGGDVFALFSFLHTHGSRFATLDEGWAKFDVTFTHSGPVVTLASYAYQNDGSPIAAGDTGQRVPEPSSGSLEVTGLAALILGGPALRRWRACRRTQRAAAI